MIASGQINIHEHLCAFTVCSVCHPMASHNNIYCKKGSLGTPARVGSKRPAFYGAMR